MTTTLCIDVGGTGLKAALVDDEGQFLSEPVRLKTPYPCPPERLVERIGKLVDGIGDYDRVSVGFPGLVRNGVIHHVPALSRRTTGGETDPELVDAWRGFDLQRALRSSLGKPLRVANDADVQGAAVVKGKGFEFVMTLGTGVGTAIFQDGLLIPHIELSHAHFRRGESFDAALGNATRKRIGDPRWQKDVLKAIRAFEAFLYFDHCFIGGGNATRMKGVQLPGNCTLVSNNAGITGGVKLWAARGR